jgi:L-gulono-1,4-lactone dehydrogenase
VTGEWKNWTGDQICRPAAVEHPADSLEVARAIDRAVRNNWTVRVAGAGHSFTDTVLTDGLLLSLDRMSRILDIDTSTRLVRVEAGITLHSLNEQLAEHNLALENMGDIDVQSIAGATSTGTHGTGARFRNLSAAIHSLELTLADGNTLEVSEQSDAETWRAARISLGALGVITAMTLRAVPAFTLRGVDETRPLEAVFDSLDESIDNNDHFEFFTFPHSPLAITRTNNRVDDPSRPRARAMAWVNDVLLVNYVFGLVCRAGRRWPSAIPKLNRLVTRVSGSSVRVDRSYRIFASPRLVRFTEMEYAIPRRHAVEVVRMVRDEIERRGFRVPFPLEVRFVAPDDALLSPAHGRETCYIAVHMFEKMEWRSYLEAVEEIMKGFEGRPHWGKRHFQTAETLRARYPEWDRFTRVRSRLDPGGRFANDYVRRVLGPLGSRPS